jgi:hypothetical protein
MSFTIDINKEQYIDLHNGKSLERLNYELKNEFIIERVGNSEQKNYQDIGIEYHRYIK